MIVLVVLFNWAAAYNVITKQLGLDINSAQLLPRFIKRNGLYSTAQIGAQTSLYNVCICVYYK
jgi:hypothetical protein